MDTPRRISIHPSINRPQVLLGGERKLVQFSMLIAFLIVISAMSFYSVICGVVLWTILISILKKLGKSDERLSQIYIRSIRYNAYYAAKSGLKTMPKRIKDWSH